MRLLNKITASFLFISILSLGACIQSSGALKIGPDTYSVSVHAAPVQGGIVGAKRVALKEANAHCSSLSKEIMISNTGLSRSTHLRGGTADITFLCLDKNDPQLKRPEYKPTRKVMPDFGFEGNIDIQN